MELTGTRVSLSFDSVGSQDTDVNGQKSPIILLHGLTSAKETWKNVIHPIAKTTRRKVYAFDARNHGDSGWSDECNYEVMQEDLLQFMNCIHAQKAILIGHSMGGKTAMYFAVKWPDRVEKLIIEDMSPKPAAPHLRASVGKYVDLLIHIENKIPAEIKDLDEAKKFANTILKDTVPEDQRSSRHGTDDGSSLPLIQDENGKYKWKSNLKAISDVFIKKGGGTLDMNGRFPGPTLILHGTKSPFKVTADRDFILSLFPGARFRAIEGAAHDIHTEYEDVFLNEVEHFINESRL